MLLCGGVELSGMAALRSHQAPVDTLIVAGGPHAADASEDPENQLSAQVTDRRPIRELQQFVVDHPAADLSLATLAARVHMSPRHFARVFRSEVGVSPGRYVEQVRLETARRRLEESDLTVDAIAAATAFGTAENLRRAFVQALSVSRIEYRRGFCSRPPRAAEFVRGAAEPGAPSLR